MLRFIVYSQFSPNRQLEESLKARSARGEGVATPGIFQVSPVTYESSILLIACAVVLLTVFRRQEERLTARGVAT